MLLFVCRLFIYVLMESSVLFERVDSKCIARYMYQIWATTKIIPLKGSMKIRPNEKKKQFSKMHPFFISVWYFDIFDTSEFDYEI